MSKLTLSTLAAATLSALVVLSPAAQADPRIVRAGLLTCDVPEGWDIVQSTRDLSCKFSGVGGESEHYTGSLSKIGVDLGYTEAGTIVWAVLAPTFHTGPGALQGEYAGVTAGATAGLGVDANIMLGGFDKSIALQPVSIEGNEGIAVDAGVSALQLSAAE
jgi:hypothetical protein